VMPVLFSSKLNIHGNQKAFTVNCERVLLSKEGELTR
jgi:hypothetical protein